jgi:hypothetical protein
MITRRVTGLLTLAIVAALALPLTASARVEKSSNVQAADLLMAVNPNLTAVAQNGYFNVSIWLINSSAPSRFWTYEVDLAFSPSLFEIQRNESETDPEAPDYYMIYQGDVLHRGSTYTLFQPVVDNSLGLLHINETITMGAAGYTSGCLFNVTFRAKGIGISTMHINRSQINPRFGAEIPHDRRDGACAVMANPYTQELDYDVHVFFLQIDSNSTLTTIELNQTGYALLFNATGVDGANGYTVIVFPKELLEARNKPWSAMFDDTSLPVLAYTNETHSLVYISYTHSTHRLRILGDTVVPEFTSIAFPIVILTATAFAAFMGKRLSRKRQLT